MLKDKMLDKAIPVPLYFQLKELILEEIKNGNYPADSMIPTENDLYNMFEISRTTVRQAIVELVNEGWLYRIKSKGTFVSRPRINQDFMKKLESYDDQIIRAGRVPKTEVLDFQVVKVTKEIAEILELEPEDKVIYLYRKRLADDEPIVILKTYLPYDKCYSVEKCDFTKESLYHILSQDDSTKVCCVKRQVKAVEATSKDADLLKMRKGQPVLASKSIGYNTYGEPIEVSYARYCGDRSDFEVVVFIDEK